MRADPAGAMIVCQQPSVSPSEAPYPELRDEVMLAWFVCHDFFLNVAGV
jgi:hypothetical protein